MVVIHSTRFDIIIQVINFTRNNQSFERIFSLKNIGATRGQTVALHIYTRQTPPGAAFISLVKPFSTSVLHREWRLYWGPPPLHPQQQCS